MPWQLVRVSLCIAALGVASCHCSHLRDEPTSDAGPSDATGPDGASRPDAAVRVTGCDDPRVWSTPLESAVPWPQLAGGPCGRAQFPSSVALLGWSLSRREVSPEERATLASSCWRVADAHEASGWSAGDVFTADDPQGAAVLAGFDRPVTFEGRVLRDDGTLAFAVPAVAVALDPERVAEPRVDDVVAVMGREAWATSHAVHLWGNSIPTDEVVGGATTLPGSPVTLHRGSEGFTLRFWIGGSDGAVSSNDLPLGTGERALLARGGMAVALDDELLTVDSDGGAAVIGHRVPLPARPLELVARYHYYVAHIPGALIHVQRTTGTSSSLDVGTGTLLATDGDDAPIFFDGESFVPLTSSRDSLGLDESRRIRPAPAHLAELGRVLAVPHGVVLGENGFMVALDETAPIPGPRFASVTDLFGDGRIAHLADDGTTYAIERADGTMTLYSAPHIAFCE